MGYKYSQNWLISTMNLQEVLWDGEAAAPSGNDKSGSGPQGRSQGRQEGGTKERKGNMKGGSMKPRSREVLPLIAFLQLLKQGTTSKANFQVYK